MSDSEFAKTHLREHLITMLVPSISKGFWSIYDTANELCDKNNQPDQTLRTFQNMLAKIPEWSEATLVKEVERITLSTQCSYLDELLMGVFIAYMKSFASLHYRGDDTHVSIDFERPSMEKFIHALYIQSARTLWQTAYLFKTIGIPNEQQARNRRDIEAILRESMEHVIRSFLPWKSIAKHFTDPPVTPVPPPSTTVSQRQVTFEEDNDSEDEDDTEEEPRRLVIGDEDATIQVEKIEDEKPDEIFINEVNIQPTDETLVLNL